MINELMGPEEKKAVEEGGAVPIFKLLRKMSMHDPNYNFGKPMKLKKKSTSVYRREMFPDPTPEEKARTNALFITSSIMRRKGERVNAIAHKEEGLVMNKVASNNRKLN